MSDTLEIFGTEYTNVTGIIAKDDNGNDLTYTRGGASPTLQTITKTYTPSTSAVTDTITASSGYDGIGEVDLTVSAVPLATYSPVVDNYFTTQNGQRKWHNSGWLNVEDSGMIEDDNYTVIDTNYNAIASGTSVTPTESAQTIGGASVMMEGAVTVNAIPSNYVGSGITSRSSLDLSASGATVTAPSGYYASSATKTISSGSATPASSISATGATVTTGTNTLTLSKSVSNTPQVSAGYISSGTAGNSSVSLTASVNTRSSSDLTASNLTVTAPSGYYASNASKTLSDQNLVASNIKKDVSIFGVTGSYEGGGGSSDVQVGMTSATANSNSSITFTNLLGEPTSYIVLAGSDISPSSTPTVASIVYDGTNIIGQTITNTSNAQVTYDSTSFTDSYSNSTLSISSGSIHFVQNDGYALLYTYGGNATNIKTADVQVGSGATSITFTGLEDDPIYWSCIFKSNFGTSSGYQRAIAVMSDPNTAVGTYGLAMDSASHLAQNWSYTSNGSSLTITSVGTNQGGYFHQPGYYQLTYAIAGDQTLQTKTVTPTTSTQNVTADTAQGYTALKKVVVNPIPSSYVQPTTTVGATTYRASTSSQTIASGTYHSAAATIAAVSQTNLSAENIKSGTTISISNGQNNLWSVTGSYTGGGGTSKNVQVLQSTSRTNSSSLTKVLGDLTVSKTGTYDVYWSGGRTNTSTSYTWGTRLYVDGTGYGTENTTWSNNCQSNHLSNVSLTANQKLSVYARGRTGSYYTFAPMLVIIEA